MEYFPQYLVKNLPKIKLNIENEMENGLNLANFVNISFALTYWHYVIVCGKFGFVGWSKWKQQRDMTFGYF